MRLRPNDPKSWAFTPVAKARPRNGSNKRDEEFVHVAPLPDEEVHNMPCLRAVTTHSVAVLLFTY